MKVSRRMSRTMNVLVAVGLVLGTGAFAWASPQLGDVARDQLTDAIQNECAAHGPSDTVSQDDKKKSHKWWRGDARAELGITEQQSRDLEAIFQQTLPTLKSHKTALDREEKALSQLLGSANSTEAVVIQAIERVEAMRSALGRTYTLMHYRMYRLLTPEQRAKVMMYHDQKSQDGSGLATRR
jgi:Spy/CpxP family protein refolding chaperone